MVSWVEHENFFITLGPGNFDLYLCVSDVATGHVYVMMEARLVALYKSEEEYKVLER